MNNISKYVVVSLGHLLCLIGCTVVQLKDKNPNQPLEVSHYQSKPKNKTSKKLLRRLLSFFTGRTNDVLKVACI